MRQVLLALALLACSLVGTSPARATSEGSSVMGQFLPDFDDDGFADLVVAAPGEDVGAVVDAGAVTVIYGSAGGLTGASSRRFTQGSAGLASDPETGDGFGDALATGDFDGDGFTDLAVGVPGEDVGTVVDAGAVAVLHGSADGLTGAGSDLLSQTSIGSTAESGDAFGTALAAGDFDGDGRADLAIGTPQENVNAVADAGVVNVLRGSADGLRSTSSGQFTQNTAGVASQPEEGDEFGFALAAGDFDADGSAELAIGVPFEAGTTAAGGAVAVLPGSASGLHGTGSRLFTQNSPGLASKAEDLDLFGASLATGDLNGDGPDDLAVGVPAEDTGSGQVENAGAVQVVYGSGTGLTGAGSDLLSQNGLPGSDGSEVGDQFGFAVAIGNFNAVDPGLGEPDTPFDDLVVGVPGEDLGSVADAGAIDVAFGASAGVTGQDSTFIDQDSENVQSAAEPGDRFGAALAVGDFNGTFPEDLAVGVPFEDTGARGATSIDAGALTELFGAHDAHEVPGGLVGGTLITQNTERVPDVSEEGDYFGDTVSGRP